MNTVNEDTQLLGRIIFKKYIITRLLVEGSFSKIFLGQSIINDKSYAIKCEKIYSKKELLKGEAFKLYSLKGFGIPELISFGRSGNYNFLIQTLLGKTLESILIEKNRKISIKDICVIAIQTLERIEFVHSKNYIHGDINPENFLLGNPDNSIIYLIDFGNSHKYRSSKTGKHIKQIKNCEICRNKKFLSLNASRGYEQSRRDDLESLGYMYIYLAKGKLPWSDDLEKINIEDFLKKSIIIKKNILVEDLCKDLPKEFCDYMNYVKKLNFEAKPNYGYLKSLFKNLLLNIDSFTWVEQNNYNHKIKIENNSFNNNLKKSKIILDRLLKNINLNKKYNTPINSRHCITNRLSAKKNLKMIFNQKNTKNDDSKEKREFSINKTNSIKIEGIQHINNSNYIKNIISDNLKKERYKKNQFLKFKEYIPKFPRKIKSDNLTYSNNKIKKDCSKDNNVININNYNINNNIINTMNNNINKNSNKIIKKIFNNKINIQRKYNIKVNNNYNNIINNKILKNKNIINKNNIKSHYKTNNYSYPNNLETDIININIKKHIYNYSQKSII